MQKKISVFPYLATPSEQPHLFCISRATSTATEQWTSGHPSVSRRGDKLLWSSWLAEAKHEAKKIEEERNKQQFDRQGSPFPVLGTRAHFISKIVEISQENSSQPKDCSCRPWSHYLQWAFKMSLLKKETLPSPNTNLQQYLSAILFIYA